MPKTTKKYFIPPQTTINGVPKWHVTVKTTTRSKTYWLCAATLTLAKKCATADHIGAFGGDLISVRGGKFYGALGGLE